MKKNKLLGLLVGGVGILAVNMPVTSFASAVRNDINVTYNDIKVAFNGHKTSLKDANNNVVDPFNYNGTVYLPIRAISQALGLTVSYDNTTNTVNLTSTATSNSTTSTEIQANGTPPTGAPPTGTKPSGNPPTGTPPAGEKPNGNQPTGTKPTGDSTENQATDTQTTTKQSSNPINKQINVTYNDIKVTLNGEQVSLKDANGNAVNPFNYNGTIYLPVRAISQALGLTVDYNTTTNTVNLTGKNMQGGPNGGQAPSNSTTAVTGTAVYTQNGETVSKSGQTISASNSNESGIKVTNSGTLTMTDSKITKTGDTTSEDSSNFYGLNAAVLAEGGSTITLKNTEINTSAEGSNAVFATGAGSVVNVSNVTIKTTANSSRGLDATLTGTVHATNVNINTAGTHCAALATDRGNGTINVTGGTMTTTGVDSPGIYSTGNITVSNANITATGSEAAVVEGKNSITLNNTTISGAKKCGVMMYQSFSGDAEVGTSIFKMTGGTLTNEVGPVFYSTNTKAAIDLKDVTINSNTGVLLNIAADRWGNTGANGADVTFKATSQELNGNIKADNISTVSITLKDGTTLKGTINSDNTAKAINLTLDLSSTWNVTGNSYLTSLTDDDSTLANIDDNGYTIYYDSSVSANNWLNGKNYTLKDGGILTPLSK